MSGPEMYGLANPNIVALIEELPGARALTEQKYQWRGSVADQAAQSAAQSMYDYIQ